MLKKTINLTNEKIGKKYAKVLFELCVGSDDKNEVFENLKLVLSTLSGNRSLLDFLTSPVTKLNDKKDVVKQIFSGHVTELSLNFLNLLCDNNGFAAFDQIVENFDDLLDEENGVLKIKITSAGELKPFLKEKLEAKLSEKYSKRIKPFYEVDSSLIAGFTTETESEKADYSFRTRLKDIEKQLI